MKKESGQFDGRENKRLFYQKWLPESNKVKACIIALHGWGTHSDRMEIPAEYFVYSISETEKREIKQKLINIIQNDNIKIVMTKQRYIKLIYAGSIWIHIFYTGVLSF